MIVDDRIKRTLAALDEQTAPSDALLENLVGQVMESCRTPENRARYRDDPASYGVLEPYPIDADGYARAFDPVHEEDAFVDAWRRYGIVVGKSIVSPQACATARTGIKQRFTELSQGACDLDRPQSWDNMPADENGTPFLSRGFFELYHDDMLAQLRQAPRAYIHHALLWGRGDLWTSFDRIGVKLPHHEESKALPLHVDQNPNVHPGFKTVQGVLALADCPPERGTFRGVPGSRTLFAHYAHMAKNMGEYVELDTQMPVAAALEANVQTIPLREGDMVSWDSRTTHANTENISDAMRMVFYMSAGLAREEADALCAARDDAFRTGIGLNLREAILHASKKPRYTNPDALSALREKERLTLLGKLLYGQASYRSIARPAAA